MISFCPGIMSSISISQLHPSQFHTSFNDLFKTLFNNPFKYPRITVSFNRLCTPKTPHGLFFCATPFRNIVVVDEQLRMKEEKSKLEEAFIFAKTTHEMINIFRDMEELGEKSGAFGDREIGFASLRIGFRLEQEGELDPEKVLPFVNTALNALNKDHDDEPSLPVAKALYLLGSLNYRLERFTDSLGYLNRSNAVLGRLHQDPSLCEKYSLVTRHVCILLYAVHLELANVKSAMGNREEALENLTKSLEMKHISMEEGLDCDEAWGMVDFKLAVNYVAALNFKEALPYVLKALEIHKLDMDISISQGTPLHLNKKVETDRKLLRIVLCGFEECDEALEQQNVLADKMQDEIDVANMMICASKCDEAVALLKNLIQQTNKNSWKRAIVLISMAKAFHKQKKYADCINYLMISVGIIDKRERISPMEVAEAYTEISEYYTDETAKQFAHCKRCLESILPKREREWVSPLEVAEAYSEISIHYETMSQFKVAVSWLERLQDFLELHPQVQHPEGSVSARIGRLLLLDGHAQKAFFHLDGAAERLEDSIGPKHFKVGYVYNNLGVGYLELDRPRSAVQMFAAAKDILEFSLGPHHADAIEACQNLSKAYGEMGSYVLAVVFQQKVIDAWESQGAIAEDELREARQLLERLKKNTRGAYAYANANANELPMKASPLPKHMQQQQHLGLPTVREQPPHVLCLWFR